MKTATDELTSSLQEVATKAYQAASSEPAPDMGADGAGTDGAGDTAGDGDDEAVEGEFKEV